MKRNTLKALAISSVIGATVVGCAVDEDLATITQKTQAPERQSASERSATNTVRPHNGTYTCPTDAGGVNYDGGPVISNVEINAVMWNNNVDSSVIARMPGFYRDFVQSPALDWLSEYSPALFGGSQRIGRGRLNSFVTLSPHITSTSINDQDIVDELLVQMSWGTIPTPNSNSLYVVHMPSNITVTDTYDNGVSCKDFIGFHTNASTYRGTLRFVVITPCGSTFDTVTASHEVVEAITDPDGWNTGQHAWLGDASGCEIADLCDSQTYPLLTIPELADRSYFVASSWSNKSAVANPGVRSAACVSQKTYASGDILWRSSSYANVWFLSTNGQYSSAGNGLAASSNWVVRGTGDFDGDGRSDIVWRDPATGADDIWLMNGAGYPTGVDIPEATTDWRLAFAADVDGDGISDLLWQNNNTGEVYVWLIGPSATPRAFASLGYATGGWTLVGSGDFNHDGRSDLFFTRSGSLINTSVWLMQGTSVLAYLQQPAQNSSYAFQGTGDVNGDGFTDIVWRYTPTGNVVIWLNTKGATTMFSTGYTRSLGSVTSDWVISKVMDVNGDGLSDLVWRNSNSGQVYDWLVPRSGSASAVYVGYATLDWWIVGGGSFD